MRIALIQVPQNNAICLIPINLLTLASYIKEHGHQPIIIDFNILLKNNNFSPDFVRKATQEILRHDPQVLGFSVMCSTLPAILLVAKECKKLAPQLPIILGGPEVSFEEIKVLKTFRQINVIVRGEGEITIVEVLRAIENRSPLCNILGITYRENDAVIRNPDRPFIKDLDELPFLDYSLLPNLERYERGQIEAGRGCPFQCTFCSSCKMWKRTFRIKSPQRLAQELKQAYQFLKKDEKFYIRIIHDNFLASRKVVDKFLSLIANEGIPWLCDARLEVLDDNLIKKLKEAGCHGILLGIESASPKIQKEIKKKLSLKKLPMILELLSQNGLQATLSIIIGFPNENIHQINQTLHLAFKSKLHHFSPYIQAQTLTFLKGSDLYEQFKEKFKRPYLQQTKSLPLTTSLPAELSLIKKDPDIFSSFYHIKENSLHPEFLEKTCILTLFLAGFFPLTTLLFLKSFSLTPIQFIQKIISFFDSTGPEWITFQDEKHSFDYYLPYFEKFIDNISTPLIKETFIHEMIFRKSGFIKNSNFCPKLIINYSSCPKISSGTEIRTYNYDIFDLIDKLRLDQIKNIPKAETYVVYIPGEIVQAFPLSPLSYYLLSFCNGKRSIREIIDQILVPENRTKERAEMIMNNFGFLQERGIIYDKSAEH